MTKSNQSSQDPATVTPYFQVFFKKFKRLKPLESSSGVLGLFILTLFCFLFFFFYLDYRVFIKGLGFQGKTTQGFVWLRLDDDSVAVGGDEGIGRVGFLEEGGERCDLFQGQWVWDESYPIYQSRECGFLDQGFRCNENGRPDDFYTKWRWQPKDCDLPRFDANVMLEKLRNRRLVFVGDSIGRNQWESLLCMLSSGIADKSSIYEVNGSPITKHKGFLVFKFRDYNCTVEYYRAPFLVVQSRPPPKAPEKVKTTLKLDQMDWSSVRWKDADVLVFNTGHWWNYEKTMRGGCYFQEGEMVNMNMSTESAYRRSIETLVNWIGREVNASKTQVFFRSYAPVHFRGGDWKSGGSCHLEKLPELSSSVMPSKTWVHFDIVNEVLTEHSNKSITTTLDLLNVTYMTSWRKDGHSSIYYTTPTSGPAPLHRQDCSHWCLPGVPDAWNELLYALFLKREATRLQNSTMEFSKA